ncbi:RHS repeat-associated core domain-containing protein [Chryseobacterium shandongense]|uniref:RHS repeat-associated core domain-containing protein n=1 Tax=Chryseobacterium shandongense TaxID=1493872 RepID=UPI000F4FDEFC|nr:RHS repeat-associated core domain-containing protein [Chryseobacterium shandongense]AZA58516.1 type IV secretion protein Rhs [Chryseobacterium shandongense]
MKKIIVILTAILAFCNLYGQNNFHDTQGKVEVNAGGQLQYTLPIALPPGVKSVSPNISLMYLSNSSNGIAGYGWTISGITSITRTGKSIERDGDIKAIQLDYSDSYSFNGQRLILAPNSPAAYGQDGATYVTEKFSNIKIKSLGTYPVNGQFAGPAEFEVTFEDGSQAWYGVYKAGTRNNVTVTSPSEYNIVKWRDAQGNYISYNYEYTAHSGGFNFPGTLRISSIFWGGNDFLNKPHYNSVEFTYTERNLKEQAYIQGLRFIQDKILSGIIVNTNGSQFRKYLVEYTSNGTNYQFLNKITEYNANNETANPVTFTYPDRTGTSIAGANFGSSTLEDVKLTGDFNGDSYIDFIMSNGTVKLGAFNDNYTEVATNKVFNTEAKVVTTMLDEEGQIYNGNGIVQYESGKVVGYIFRANTFVKVFEKLVYADPSCINQGNNSCSIQMASFNEGDINGDGISDVFVTINKKISEWVEMPCNGTTPVIGVGIDDGGPCYGFQQYTQLVGNFIVDLKNANNPLYSYTLDAGINDNQYTDQKYLDADGDGKVDIINISNTSYTVFEFAKVSATEYLKKIKFTGNLAETKGTGFPVLFGDFNGDSKLDFTLPLTEGKTGKDDWRFYIGTGNGFNSFRRNDFLVYKNISTTNNGYWLQFSKTFYSISDLNSDGKSDIVQVYSYSNSSGSSYRSIGVTVNSITSNGTNMTDGSINFDFENIYSFPSPGTYTLIQPYDDLSIYQPITNTIRSNNNYYNVFLFRKDVLLKIKAPTPIAELARIKSVSQGGLTTSVTYAELNPDTNSNYYKKEKKEYYPFFSMQRADQSYAVVQLQQAGRKQDFRYRGMTGHLQGRGMLGFSQSARSSWYADGFENTKIWSGVETDPQNESVPVKEWSIKTNDESKIFPAHISENNTQLLSFKGTTYQTDKLLNGQVVTTIPDADKPKVVTAIVPKTTKTKDFITNTIAVSSISYGSYYLPSQTVSNINNGYAINTTTYEYLHNLAGVGNNYFTGRPLSKTEQVTAYGDTQSAKEEYTYDNNLLKTVKKWNKNNTGSTLDTYSYDGFGNITQKVSTNSVDAQNMTEKSQYEDKGRFVIKKTDNLGLETLLTYNNWGQTLTQKDPFGNMLTNTYDNWGKLLSSNSTLGGTTSYTYERLSGNAGTKVSEFLPDGDVKIVFTNTLGQNYKTTTKAFVQGKYISAEIQYDVLGRKLKESEPYFEGQSASQWNTIAYDDTVYPAKVTATSFNGKNIQTTIYGYTTTVKELNGYNRTTGKTTDALGNVISTTDKGGTIVFSYNAAGQQIKAKYGDNTVVTGYDEWGRKISFHDPANGLYNYEYTGFGTIKKEISPKGYKEYTYASNGLPVHVKEISNDGVSTQKHYEFEYNAYGQIAKKYGDANGRYFIQNFTYSPDGRLIAHTEQFEGKTFFKDEIQYDALGRVSQFHQGLQSQGGTTEVTVQNNYSSWNGDLENLSDANSGKTLYQLQETNAKGQVLNASLGNTQISNQYDSFGFLSHVSHTSGNADLMTLEYSFNAIKNELNQRYHKNFDIDEVFEYDDNNRLVNWTNPKTGQLSFNEYDETGRIRYNDQLGEIGFNIGGNPYRVTHMKLNAEGIQNYDVNGQSRVLQKITYNENNDPVKIDGTRGDYAFGYGLSESRQIMYYGGNFEKEQEARYAKYYNEGGDAEIIIDQKSGKEKHILYIGGSPYESSIIYVKDFNEDKGYKFLHKDYLGSILAISDEEGNAEERRHFDAWGIFTHLRIKEDGIIKGQALEEFLANKTMLIDRGYTSHEHLHEVELIHMNGRLYDPLLRRFLNSDENIQDPANTQNYNKYGYVMNNPLMFNDPSGEVFQFLLAWGMSAFWASVTTGAIIGAAISAGLYSVKAMITGNWSWGGFGKSLLVGAVTGAISGGFSSTFAATGVRGAVVMGSVQGAIGGTVDALVNGRNFVKGFYTGGLVGAAMGAVTYTVSFFAQSRYTSELTKAEYDKLGIPESEEALEPSRNTLKKMFKETGWDKMNTGAKQFYVDQPGGNYIRKGDLYFNTKTGEDVIAYTRRNFWDGNTSSINFSKAAFGSKIKLGFTMMHELGHSTINLNDKLTSFLQVKTKSGYEPELLFPGVSKLTIEHGAIWGIERDFLRLNGYNNLPGFFDTSLDDIFKSYILDSRQFKHVYDAIKHLPVKLK